MVRTKYLYMIVIIERYMFCSSFVLLRSPSDINDFRFPFLGTDINAVSRSFGGEVLATADDHGQVKLFRYPVVEGVYSQLIYPNYLYLYIYLLN